MTERGLRKQVLSRSAMDAGRRPGEKNIAALATVLVTSEDPAHPIDNAFDDRRGPGGTRWVAEEAGEQVVILAFDEPQAIREVAVEIEERDVSRTQELALAVSCDGGQTYRELLRQEYTFSPPSTAVEREQWTIHADAVSHLRVTIKPDKGGRPCRATLTTLAVA
jgi:hypothetical protein